jgi:hypothetical protein
VTFSKSEGGLAYERVARGTWRLGEEPAITGEPIPPEVIKGLEVQTAAMRDHKGTVTYDRADVRYAMDFETLEA